MYIICIKYLHIHYVRRLYFSWYGNLILSTEYNFFPFLYFEAMFISKETEVSSHIPQSKNALG